MLKIMQLYPPSLKCKHQSYMPIIRKLSKQKSFPSHSISSPTTLSSNEQQNSSQSFIHQGLSASLKYFTLNQSSNATFFGISPLGRPPILSRYSRLTCSSERLLEQTVLTFSQSSKHSSLKQINCSDCKFWMKSSMEQLLSGLGQTKWQSGRGSRSSYSSTGGTAYTVFSLRSRQRFILQSRMKSSEDRTKNT